MPLPKPKPLANYATDVSNMGFAKIKANNVLFNTVSKALEKANNKDQFVYLNDKNRDPQYLFDKYVSNGNSVNVADSLIKTCKANQADPGKFKSSMEAITKEVNSLFNNNLKGALLTSEAFAEWVRLKWLDDLATAVGPQATKAAKLLGIKDVKKLTKLMVLLAIGDKAGAEKIGKELETAEKIKDLFKGVQKAVA